MLIPLGYSSIISVYFKAQSTESSNATFGSISLQELYQGVQTSSGSTATKTNTKKSIIHTYSYLY